VQSLKDNKLQQANRVENKNMDSSYKQAINEVISTLEKQITILERALSISGSSMNRKSRICKIGSGRIRKALHMPATVVNNRNSHFKMFCQRSLVFFKKINHLTVI
jgi:acetamidase/formamidase